MFSIQKNAFKGCTSLSLVRCEAIIAPIAEESSFENYENIILEVPERVINSYKIKDVWKNFGTIRAFEANGGSDISQVTSSNLEIKSTPNSFIIEGITTKLVDFYNLSGIHLGSVDVVNGKVTFETDEKFVIIKTGNKSIKIKK